MLNGLREGLLTTNSSVNIAGNNRLPPALSPFRRVNKNQLTERVAGGRVLPIVEEKTGVALKIAKTQISMVKTYRRITATVVLHVTLGCVSFFFFFFSLYFPITMTDIVYCVSRERGRVQNDGWRRRK